MATTTNWIMLGLVVALSIYIVMLKAKLADVRWVINGWIAKEGEEQCHYFPEIFRLIAHILNIDVPDHILNLPPREKFEAGCTQFQDDAYAKKCPR